MTLEKANRIKEEAKQVLNDKITVIDLGNGNARLNIGDFEFTDAAQAYLHIQHIALFSLVSNHSNLVA